MTAPMPASEERTMLDPRAHELAAPVIRELGLSDRDVEETVDLFAALLRWRRSSDAEREASRRLMRLGDSDMRAIRFLLASRGGDRIITSTMLAEHLGLRGSSVTKLLDRLQQAGHIRREPHPTDRRAHSIVVTDATAATANESVGRAHLRRFRVAAALSSADRATVTQFLSAISDCSMTGRE